MLLLAKRKHSHIVYLKSLIHFHRSCVTGLAIWYRKTQYMILKGGHDLYNLYIHMNNVTTQGLFHPYKVIECCTDGIHKQLILIHRNRDKNNHNLADDILSRIFVNQNVWISIKMSLKFVLNGPVANMPAYVQIVALCQTGDKPISGPMVA